MAYIPQIRVKATYMRGGTSKGTFFNIADLPKEAQEDKVKRDKLLQRIVGSPDIYKQQMDGMGGATSSTSKAILVGKNQLFQTTMLITILVKLQLTKILWTGVEIVEI